MVNHEIVTLAVFLVGGDLQYVDTEDVAKQADRLAPGRFTWRKYKDQINIENVRAFLSDATKQKNGAYLCGSGKQGWMLTPAGLTFAQAHVNELEAEELSRDRPTKKEVDAERWKERERTRLLNTEALRKWSTGKVHEISVEDAHAFFRIDDYVVGNAKTERVQRIRNVCVQSNEQVLIDLAEHLARTF